MLHDIMVKLIAAKLMGIINGTKSTDFWQLTHTSMGMELVTFAYL